MSASEAYPHQDAPGSIFLRFLKFGALAWGGPAAQIAMIKRECVDQENWVSEETFKKTLAVYQVLPGPEAHELCVYFGRIRGGRLGAFLAGLGFMLPGFVLMLGLSVLYVEAELSGNLDELFYGLKAAVVAIIARALVRLSQTFITDVPLAVLAVGAFALTVFADAGFVIVLLGAVAGVMGVVVTVPAPVCSTSFGATPGRGWIDRIRCGSACLVSWVSWSERSRSHSRPKSSGRA